MLYMLYGAAAAYLCAKVTVRLGPLREKSLWSWVLGVVAALNAFLLLSVGGLDNIPPQAAAFAGIIILGCVGARKNPVMLAGAWMLHAFAVIFSGLATGVETAPAWYPNACTGFSMLAAGYLFSRRQAME